MAVQDKTVTQHMTKTDICMRYGEEYDKNLGAVGATIYQTSLFTRMRESHGYSYSRINNPTVELPERKIAALEGGEAANVASSGMAAISSAILSVLSQGDHVICLETAYISTRIFLVDYMKRFGVETTLVRGDKVEQFEEAIRPNTKLIYLESPSSNLFILQDIEAIAALAKSKGITTIIDNTWATPLYQNPIAMGIDMVVHSCTKYMGGHSDLTAGVVVGSAEHLARMVNQERAMLGACLDPMSASMLTRGLRTLPMRMQKHQENGMKVAAYLENHPKVACVIYPCLPSHPQYELGKKQMTGYNGLVCFALKSGNADYMQFIKGLHHFEEGPSWGGYECIINAPGGGLDEETSKRTGVPMGLMRLSLGLEDTDTILEDIEQSLSRIQI